MKHYKIFVFLAFAIPFALISCTENQRARQFGGTLTVDLPPGQHLISATWKQDDLFYLYEPADSGYVPRQVVFQESSSFGVLESKVLFVEH